MIKDEATTQLIQTITESIRKTSDFAVERMPDIAQSYILYGRVSAIIYGLIFLSMAVGCIYVIKKRLKDLENDEPFIVIMAAIGVFLFSIITLCVLNDILLAFLAPKAFLLKDLLQLFK